MSLSVFGKSLGLLGIDFTFSNVVHTYFIMYSAVKLSLFELFGVLSAG